MERADVVIVGASAAGLSAALTIKRNKPDAKVVLFRKVEKTPVPCGIPYIYGTLKDVKRDIIPDEHFSSMGIDIRVAEVKKIDKEKKRFFITETLLITISCLLLPVQFLLFLQLWELNLEMFMLLRKILKICKLLKIN